MFTFDIADMSDPIPILAPPTCSRRSASEYRRSGRTDKGEQGIRTTISSHADDYHALVLLLLGILERTARRSHELTIIAE